MPASFNTGLVESISLHCGPNAGLNLTPPIPPHPFQPAAAAAMATLERAPTTSGGATRKEGAAAPATTTNPRSSSTATAASTTTTTASSSEEQHTGPVFAQLRHGHVQVTMGGPARFALATPRQLQLQQQQQLDAEEVVKTMRKAHTVHPLVRAGPNHGGRAKASGGGGRHGAVSPAGEDGTYVPFVRFGLAGLFACGWGGGLEVG